MKCYLCSKSLTREKYLVDTRDSQTVYVGGDCYRKIISAGEEGVAVTGSGLRLYVMPNGYSSEETFIQ